MRPSEGRVSDQHLAVNQNLQQHKALTEPVELFTFSGTYSTLNTNTHLHLMGTPPAHT